MKVTKLLYPNPLFNLFIISKYLTAVELIKIGRNIKESYVVLCGKKSAYIESKDERLIKEVEKYYEEYKPLVFIFLTLL